MSLSPGNAVKEKLELQCFHDGLPLEVCIMQDGTLVLTMGSSSEEDDAAYLEVALTIEDRQRLVTFLIETR